MIMLFSARDIRDKACLLTIFIFVLYISNNDDNIHKSEALNGRTNELDCRVALFLTLYLVVIGMSVSKSDQYLKGL